ncbi:hypothetical protein, partial [Longimicrobium sp.]|uniref:hypothetical protein n=1 Tax=Longimicrobium sp. TaxID=2029185 RepID=UPI002E31CF0A
LRRAADRPMALDGTRRRTTIDQFRERLSITAADMVEGARELRDAVTVNGRKPVTILHRSAAGAEDDPRLEHVRAPKLVVTSPPYPGGEMRPADDIAADIWRAVASALPVPGQQA